MALPIIEDPIYGQVKIETSPWVNPFVFTDRTAELVGGISYSEGGRLVTPGSSQVDVGRLTATFKNLATIPDIGSVVRISFNSFGGYAFTGYVQDVGQQIVFDQSVSYTTPVTLTTLYCNDWVGYVSQFQAVGAGGNATPGGGLLDESAYYYFNRVQALNQIQDSTNNTKIIETLVEVNERLFGDTDLVGSLTEHLDLIAQTQPTFYWFGGHTIPTNITTGRDSLIYANLRSQVASTGKTFTDVAGSAGQLHYTEIDFENSTANVANNIVLNNRSRFYVEPQEVTRIGGFNEENYVVVNNTNVVGIGRDETQEVTDATSVTAYGVRRAEINTNVSYYWSTAIFNLIVNPSAEYSDDGYSAGANSRVRRRVPAQDANPFDAYVGDWAMRVRQSTANTQAQLNFSGGESDGIPVVSGTTYYAKVYAARGTVSRTDMRAQVEIRWFDDNETLLSSTTGSNVTLTNANQWYLLTASAAAPANAVRATIRITYSRSGGGNISVGDRLWADAFMFAKTNSTYIDGDTAGSSAYLYGWTGGVGASPSYRVDNLVDDAALEFLAEYATTEMRVTRIRWNAQEDLTATPALVVGKSISLIYDGITTTYRIIGIDGNISPDRYMIDYYLTKD